MAIKRYDWANGAPLEDHTKRKHKVLREYFHRYLAVRCRRPQQTRFRLAVIDGFSGAGRYACGSGGSPIILIEELRASIEAVNLHRATQNLPLVEVECLLIFNDESVEAIQLLKEHCAPLLADIRENSRQIHIATRFVSGQFEASYAAIQELVVQGGYKSVFF